MTVFRLKEVASRPYFLAFLFIAFVVLHLLGVPSYSQRKESDPDEAMRNYMLEISRQLGVTCNYCHDVNNYKDDSMEAYKISKDHMRLVHLLNTEGFVGPNAPRVDCYLCHRGEAKPPFREPRPL